ncbi:MAG: fluoride efflux transporter CrcB [Pseudomonadota bacterium]
MLNLLMVCTGGAIGAGARYLVNVAALHWMGPGYPWGTLTVNVVGSFLMGLAAHWIVTQSGLSVAGRLFIMTGIFGGFTTFSAYALDVVMLAERGAWWSAVGYAMVSVIGAISALLLGMALARSLSP